MSRRNLGPIGPFEPSLKPKNGDLDAAALAIGAHLKSGRRWWRRRAAPEKFRVAYWRQVRQGEAVALARSEIKRGAKVVFMIRHDSAAEVLNLLGYEVRAVNRGSGRRDRGDDM